jgi:hypothetical protein
LFIAHKIQFTIACNKLVVRIQFCIIKYWSDACSLRTVKLDLVCGIKIKIILLMLPFLYKNNVFIF